MLTIRNQIPTLQNPTLGSAFDIGISHNDFHSKGLIQVLRCAHGTM